MITKSENPALHFSKEAEKSKLKEIKKVKKTKLSNQSENPILHFSKEEEEGEINRLTEVVTERLKEYREALQYFKTNDFPELQKQAINKANKINLELRKIQSGKWNQVNEFDLPDPITPEFIYGHDKEERNRRFEKLISEFSKEKDLIQEEMNNKIEEMRKLPKGKQKQAMEMAKPELDAMKVKRIKYEKNISVLREQYQNKWVPAPLFGEDEEETSVEKINPSIPGNTLRIIFGSTNYIKKKKLFFVVRIEPEYNLEKTFEQDSPGNWSQQIDFEVTENYSKLYNARIEVEIFRKKLFKEKHKGKFVISLAPLKSHNEFVENECKIELDSKREGIKCAVGVKVRKALKEKEYTILRKTTFKISKMYPPFNVKGPNTAGAINFGVQAPKVTAEALNLVNSGAASNIERAPAKAPAKVPARAPAKAPVKAQVKTQVKAPAHAPVRTQINQGEQKQSAPIKKQGGGGPKIIVDKSEFSEEELNDPDNINNLKTLMVLDFKQKKYEDISKKIDGRTPKELMQRIIKIKCKKNILNDSLGEDIGPQDYLLLLKSTFDHDKKLAAYFNQIKDTEKAKLVSERLPLLIKETEELMKQMPK